MVGEGSTERAGAEIPRRLLGVASSIVWIVGALVLGWFLWPSSLGGCTTLTIVSGQSMEPTYHTGDLVVSRCGPVEVGDVIVYNPPNVGGARVIHRIVGGDADGGWVVQGDNNDFLDPWLPKDEQILGSARVHLPGVGTFAAILLSPLTWISLLIIALAVVVWPGRKDTDDQDGPEDADPEEPLPGRDDAQAATETTGTAPEPAEPTDREDAELAPTV